jgi:hypothetical protein
MRFYLTTGGLKLFKLYYYESLNMSKSSKLFALGRMAFSFLGPFMPIKFV